MKTLALVMVLLNPVRLYFQPDHPVTLSIEKQPPTKLALLSPDNALQAEAVVPADSTTLDLGALLPKIWDGQTHYVQGLDAEGKSIGAPIAVVPLWPPDPSLREHLKQERKGKPMGLRVFVEQHAVMHTSEGLLTARFYHADAPNSAKNFCDLVAGGLYTDLPFHRVLPGFVIQGGDPTGTGMGGPGHMIDLERNPKKHTPGVLSMARSGNPDSGGSQFFICLGAPAHLDNNYAAFGEVITGMDVVKKIGATPLADPQAGKPVKAPMLLKAELVPAAPREVRR